MKRLNTFFVVAIAATSIALCIDGCKSTTIQVIDNNNVVTNTIPMKQFNDETYIWENWSFSTNQVDVNQL